MQSYTLRKLIAKKIPIVLYACNKTSESNNDKTTNNHRATLDTCKIQQYLTTTLKDVTVINAAEFQECASVVQSTIVTKQNGNLCVSVLNGPLHRLKTGSTVFISNIDRNVNLFYFLKDKMRTASFVFSSAERLHFKRVMEIGVVRHERVHWLVNAVNERFGVEGSNYGVLKDFILPGRDEPYLKDEVSVVDGEFYVQVREEQQMDGLPKEYERRVRLYRLLSLVYAEEGYEKRIMINAYLRENCGLTEEDVLSSFVSTSWNDQRGMFYEDGLSFQSNHPNRSDRSG
ncbi:DNA replication licensing factor, MCM2 component, partial [Trachipleistophora hominis]